MTAGEGYIEMTMHRRVFLPLLSTFAFGQYEESKGDVPWVPTPDEVMRSEERRVGKECVP